MTRSGEIDAASTPARAGGAPGFAWGSLGLGRGERPVDTRRLGYTEGRIKARCRCHGVANDADISGTTDSIYIRSDAAAGGFARTPVRYIDAAVYAENLS